MEKNTANIKSTTLKICVEMDKNNIIWANIQNLGRNIPYLDNFYGFPGDKLLILSVGGKQLSFPGD